jgi:S-adenosylmethionine decarboxylase
MTGIEWLIEVFGCPEARLRDPSILAGLFESVIDRMDLKPVGTAVWHSFPDTGGVTGIWLLQESHLTIHTFPEYHSACINVFCCSPRQSLDWRSTLSSMLGATETQVREYQRVYQRRS